MSRRLGAPLVAMAKHGALVGAAIVLSAGMGYAISRDQIRVFELVGSVLVLALAIRWPRHSLPFAIPATLLFGPITGGRSWLAVPLALAASWVLHLLTRRCRIYPLQHGLLLAFGGWLLLAYLVDDTHLETQLSPGQDLLTLLIGLSLCAIAISLPPSRQLMLSVGAASAAILSIVVLLAPTANDPRVGVLGMNSNYVGLALALGGVAAVAGWLGNKRNPLWIGAFLACAVALRATESRSALLALAAGLGTLTLFGKRPLVQVAAALGIGALVLVPGVLDAVISFTVGPRTATDFSVSYQVRADAALTAMRYIISHPVLGVGYGQFAAIAYQDPLLAVYLNTHNDFLRLAAESGIPALGLFLASAVLAWSAGGAWRPSTGKAVLLTYLVGLLFANTLSSLAVTTPFWIWFGMALARSAREPAIASDTRKSLHMSKDPRRMVREPSPRVALPEALAMVRPGRGLGYD